MVPDPTLGELPEATLIVECDECPRISRHLTSALIARFGADAKVANVIQTFCRRASSSEENHHPRLVGILPRKE